VCVCVQVVAVGVASNYSVSAGITPPTWAGKARSRGSSLTPPKTLKRSCCSLPPHAPAPVSAADVAVVVIGIPSVL